MLVAIAGNPVGIDVRGAGVPLILIHGFPLHRGMFAPQLEGLSSVAKVIGFDVPGVGESEAGPVSMNEIADLTAGRSDGARHREGGRRRGVDGRLRFVCLCTTISRATARIGAREYPRGR